MRDKLQGKFSIGNAHGKTLEIETDQGPEEWQPKEGQMCLSWLPPPAMWRVSDLQKQTL